MSRRNTGFGKTAVLATQRILALLDNALRDDLPSGCSTTDPQKPAQTRQGYQSSGRLK